MCRAGWEEMDGRRWMRGVHLLGIVPYEVRSERRSVKVGSGMASRWHMMCGGVGTKPEAAVVEQIVRQQRRGRAAGRSEGGVSSTADGEMMAAVIEPLAETEAAAVEPLVRPRRRGRAAGRGEGWGSSTDEGEKMALVIEPLAETEAAAIAPLGEARAAAIEPRAEAAVLGPLVEPLVEMKAVAPLTERRWRRPSSRWSRRRRRRSSHRRGNGVVGGDEVDGGDEGCEKEGMAAAGAAV